jgi:hypothetical protein
MLRGNPSVLAPASNPGLIDLPRRGSFPRGQYNGSIRFMSVFDPGTHAWSIYWIDSRYPSARIENPVVGGFAGGRGLFFCDDEWEGRLVRTRFVWHVEGPDSCHWEQALSPDRGATWETNWTMDFERISS